MIKVWNTVVCFSPNVASRIFRKGRAGGRAPSWARNRATTTALEEEAGKNQGGSHGSPW